MKKNQLTLYIFLALILGVLVGSFFPHIAVKLNPLSETFLRMIKMIIAPLLFATLVVGIAGHGNFKGLGKIGIKTIIYFEIATTLALLIGLGVANIIKPGHNVNILASSSSMTELSKLTGNYTHSSLLETFTHMIPTSIVDSMARGDLLQVVVFALFFSIAIANIGDKGRPILKLMSSLSEIMFKVTEYVMMFAPVGVFAAIACTVGKNGPGVLFVYGKLIGSLYLALGLFLISVLVSVCKIIKVPFFSLIKALIEPALLAFSTASSEAALPKSMEIMEKFGVPKNIVSFVMPTGYTFNLDGTTLYLSLATLFVAQMAGINLSLTQQLMIMLTLMLTSKGMAGVPRISLVVLTGTLLSFNLPVAGVAVILGIDQILDMGRTTVNLIGNCVASVVIARWESSFDYEKMNTFIKNREARLASVAGNNQELAVERGSNKISFGHISFRSPINNIISRSNTQSKIKPTDNI